MAIEDLSGRNYKATQPFDANDTPKFSQLVETAKDAFIVELTDYFNYKTSDASMKFRETPNIQKFALGASTGERSLQTVVDIIVSYADTPDKFPMISITSANVREKKLGLGSNYVTAVQYPPSIVGTSSGPFNLDHGTDDPWTLELETCPSGDIDEKVTSTITINKDFFVDPTNVTALELVTFINRSQALYYRCYRTSSETIRIEAGGPASKNTLVKYVGITGGSSELLSRLGFTVGDSDDYLSTSNPPRNRYVIASDMVINIDVVTDSLTTRTELQDLVFSFFAFYLEKRRFEWFGRSYFDRDIDPEEWFHILFKNQFSWSTEITRDRQGGEQYDKIYAVRGSVPIFIEDFVDRKLINEPYRFYEENTVEYEIGQAGIEGTRSYDSIWPSGDYETGINYNKES